MNELKFEVVQQSGVINADFDTLEAQLSEKMIFYKDVTVCEESMKIGKKEVASLRKLKTSVDERRKEVKRAYLEPYNVFEDRVKRLISLIDEPINLINGQVKDLEEKQKKEKRELIEKIFKSLTEGLGEYLSFDRVFNPKWLNVSVKQKAIVDEISGVVEKVRNDIQTLDAVTSDAKEKAVEMYKQSLDLSRSLVYINQYEAQKAEILRKNEENERQRIRDEERNRIREEEKIRKEAKQEAVKEIATVDEKEAAPLSSTESIKAIYTVVATPDELREIEMALTSLGVYFERKDV